MIYSPMATDLPSRHSWARYALVLGAAALLVVGLAVGILTGARRLGGGVSADRIHLDYQLAKIGRGEVPDTVFLGDSSLGFSISAQEWSRLSGRPTVNL